jgi:putative peptidoglycan lipid II flippase
MKRLSSLTRILSSSVALGVVVLATRAVAGAKDIVVSRTFGTSQELDAFLLAFGIVGFIGSAIANASTSTLVPALARARNAPEPEAEARLIVVATAAALILCALIAGVAILFRTQLSIWIAPGFRADRVVAVQRLLIVLAPVPVLATLQSVIASTLNTRYGFRGAAAITVLTPLCVTATLLLRRNPSSGDLASATMAGMALETCCLVLLAKQRKIALIAAVPWKIARTSVSALARDFFPLVAGTALGSTSPLVDQAFASMAGPGSVSTLNYGNRLTTLAMGIGISSVGLIALPHFSDIAAREAWGEMKALLRKLALSTFLLGLPAAIAISVLSSPLLRLIFQHGHFLASDTASATPIQAMYAIQIPFHLTGIVGVRALNAMRQNRTIMIIVGWNVISNVAGDYVFMKLFGLRGVALSTSTSYIVSCFVVLTFAQLELSRRARLS